MHKVLYVGPHPCSAISKILKEEGTEAWYAENSQGTTIRYKSISRCKEITGSWWHSCSLLSLGSNWVEFGDFRTSKAIKRCKDRKRGVGVVGTNFINSCKVSKTMGN